MARMKVLGGMALNAIAFNVSSMNKSKKSLLTRFVTLSAYMIVVIVEA